MTSAPPPSALAPCAYPDCTARTTAGFCGRHAGYRRWAERRGLWTGPQDAASIYGLREEERANAPFRCEACGVRFGSAKALAGHTGAAHAARTKRGAKVAVAPETPEVIDLCQDIAKALPGAVVFGPRTDATPWAHPAEVVLAERERAFERMARAGMLGQGAARSRESSEAIRVDFAIEAADASDPFSPFRVPAPPPNRDAFAALLGALEQRLQNSEAATQTLRAEVATLRDALRIYRREMGVGA